MPSLELTKIVEKYEENMPEGRDDSQRRIEACQQMWQLRDPEAILVLKIIYEEDPDPLVQAEAAEGLTNFRRIQREREAARSGKKSTGTGLGWRLLRSILLLTFVGLLILNGVFFWANSQDESNDENEVVSENANGITENSDRPEVIDAFEQSLSQLVDDSLKLQIEWRKIEDGSTGDCAITLNRPAPLSLSESQAQQFPDINNIIGDSTDEEYNDYEFSFTAYNSVLSFWDAYCAGTLPDSNIIGNVDLLREPIALATNIRANIIPTLRAATAIPTIGPSPTDTLPPSPTPPPTATLTPEPLANVRYEEHLSALEANIQENRRALELLEIKWNPDTRGRPICESVSLTGAYMLPPDQQGDPDLDAIAQLVIDATNDAAEADRLFLEHCNNGTLPVDPDADINVRGLGFVNDALAKFDMAQQQIDALRIRLSN